MDPVTLTIDAIEHFRGTSFWTVSGWTRAPVRTWESFTTNSSLKASLCERAMKGKALVTITWEPTKRWGRDIVSVERAA